MKSKMKWVGLLGLVLSAFSIFIHFLLARFTQMGVAEYESSVTIFSWRPVFEKPIPPTNVIFFYSHKDLTFFIQIPSGFFSSTLHCFGNPLYSGGVFVVQNFGFVLRKMTMVLCCIQCHFLHRVQSDAVLCFCFFSKLMEIHSALNNAVFCSLAWICRLLRLTEFGVRCSSYVFGVIGY